MLLCQRQCQIHSDGGLALVFQETCDHDHLAVIGKLFHPAAQLADIFDKAEAGGRVGDEDTGLAAGETGLQGLVLALVGDLTQTLAVQDLICLIFAADGLAEEGEDSQRCYHCCGGEDSHSLHLSHGIVAVGGGKGHGGSVKHFQCSGIQNLIGQILVVVNDRLGYQECRPGIGGSNPDIDQIGVRDNRGGDGAVEGGGTEFFQDIFAKERTVEQLFEHGSQGSCVGKIVIYRRRAAPGGDHIGGGGRVNGGIAQVGPDVGAHANDQCSQDDEQPAFEHILYHDDGVESQETVLGLRLFLMIHSLIPPRRRSAGRCR